MKSIFFELIHKAKALQLLPSCKNDPANCKLENIFGDPDSLVNNATNIALGLAGGIAVIFILIGAFYYFTAYGNEEKATKGKTTVMWALIGVALIVLSKLIVSIMINLIQ